MTAVSATSEETAEPSARFAAGLVALLTLCVGLLRAGDEPYWLDESVSALVVRRSFAGLSHVLWDQEAGMASYYTGLWVWSQAFGSDYGLRMFSGVGGAVTAALMFLLANRWFGKKTAWLACALLITNPFFLRYLTELRTYSWLMAAALGTAILLDDAAVTQRRRSALLAGLVIGLGAASHLMFVLLPIILIGTASLCRRRIKRSDIALMVLVASLTLLPAIPGMIARRSQLDWLVQQNRSVYIQQLTDLGGGQTWLAILAGGMLLAVISVRNNPARAWPVLGCAVPVVLIPLATLLASTVKFLFLARYLTPAFPFLVLAAAAGFGYTIESVVGRRGSAAGVWAMNAALIGVFLVGDGLRDTSRGPGVAEAVEYVQREIANGDVVIVEHFRAAVLHSLGYRPDIDPAALPARDEQLAPPRRTAEEYLSTVANADAVYLIYWQGWPIEPALGALLDARSVEAVERFGTTSVFVLR